MKSRIGIAALMIAVAAPTVVATTPAEAQYRSYHGRHHYYRYRCKRSSGTTGLLAGAAGGALLGSALGGGTAGTVLGGVGGGLLGRHLDKRHDAAQNRRNGC